MELAVQQVVTTPMAEGRKRSGKKFINTQKTGQFGEGVLLAFFGVTGQSYGTGTPQTSEEGNLQDC